MRRWPVGIAAIVAAVVSGCSAQTSEHVATLPQVATPTTSLPAGVPIAVSVDHQQVAPGELVTVTVASNLAARFAGLHVDYGDGSSFDSLDDSGFRPCRGQANFTQSLPHRYRQPGSYVISVALQAGCDTEIPTTPSATVPIVVTAGPAQANGPTAPLAYASSYGRGPQDGSAVYMTFVVADGDGFVRDAVIDWGDGSSSRQGWPLTECVDPGQRWPSSAHDTGGNHAYADTGRAYVVSVHMVSVGCDGSNIQEATSVFDVDLRTNDPPLRRDGAAG